MSEDRIPKPAAPTVRQSNMIVFVFLQGCFLFASVFIGDERLGAVAKIDTSLLLLSIGLAALTFVVQEAYTTRLIFRISLILYVLAVALMSVMVMFAQWRGFSTVG